MGRDSILAGTILGMWDSAVSPARPRFGKLGKTADGRLHVSRAYNLIQLKKDAKDMSENMTREKNHMEMLP